MERAPIIYSYNYLFTIVQVCYLNVSSKRKRSVCSGKLCVIKDLSACSFSTIKLIVVVRCIACLFRIYGIILERINTLNNDSFIQFISMNNIPSLTEEKTFVLVMEFGVTTLKRMIIYRNQIHMSQPYSDEEIAYIINDLINFPSEPYI